MSTVLVQPSQSQLPRLPWELVDAITEHLHSDVPTLGRCSMVSSEWLKRSRYYVFNTVQLWPWRIRDFIELTRSKKCTFSNLIQRIELDDSRVKPDVPGVPFIDAMSLSHLSRLSQVEALQVRNVDWTALSPSEQLQLRQRLACFKLLKRLEFDDVVFHDLREVVNIVTSFPLLHHLSANVSFMKYTEHAIAHAAKLPFPRNIQTLELGTEDGIPVVLSSLLSDVADLNVTRMSLRNLKVEHLPVLRSVVHKVGDQLLHVLLGLDSSSFEHVDEETYVKALKLSRLSRLRTLQIDGLRLSQRRSILEKCLAHLLSRLESPFLQRISLSFTLHHFQDLDNFDWNQLQRVLKELHFFGLKNVDIKIWSSAHYLDAGKASNFVIEHWVRKALKDLEERGALDVTVSPLYQ